MATSGLQNQTNYEGVGSDCQLFAPLEAFAAQPGDNLITRLGDFTRPLMDQNLPDWRRVTEDVATVSQHLLLLALPWFVHDVDPMARDRLILVVFFIAGDPVTSCAPLKIPVPETFFHDFSIFSFFENYVKMKIPLSNRGALPPPRRC